MKIKRVEDNIIQESKETRVHKFINILTVGLLCFGMVSPFPQLAANASESGIINYNQKNGNNTNSADHTPAASNPNDIHISHGDSDGFDYKVPGSHTTYYADKNSPLYKQLHGNHGGSNGSSNYHSNSSDEMNSGKMPKLSSSKPKHKKTVTTTTKMTKPKLTKNGKDLALIHRSIITVGVAVVLFGIIYGIVHMVTRHRYFNN